MYEKCKTYFDAVKSQITVKRFIVFACALLLLIGACQLIDGYITARGNYNRAIERLEQTQNELNRSRRLNQELKLVIERSSELNSQAGDRIERIEGYQQETGRRVSESVANNNRASGLISESLDIIRRVENGNKEQPKN